MRLTRILSTILAFVMVIGCFAALPAGADQTNAPYTVYVDGTEAATGDGTQASPYKTVTEAISKINAASVTEATIIIAGNTNLPKNSSYTDDAHTATITYTGINDAVLTFEGTRRMNGPTVLKNLKIAGGKDIYAMGHKFVVDEGVVTSGNFTISGATTGTANFDNPVAGDVAYGIDLTVKSGTWNDIYFGKWGGRIDGDVNIVIEGAGTVVNDLWLGTENSGYKVQVSGKTNIEINNGTFRRVIMGSTGLSTGTNPVIYGEGIKLSVRGGTIATRFGIHDSCGDQVSFNTAVIDYSGASDATKTNWTGKFKTTVANADYTSDIIVTDCAVAGAQPSLDKTAARFVIGIRDYENKKASVKIIARDADNNVIKTFETPIYEVYTSVLANKSGSPEAITAKEMGANYIMAVTIKNIPTSGVASFEVIPTFDGVVAPATTFAYPLS